MTDATQNTLHVTLSRNFATNTDKDIILIATQVSQFAELSVDSEIARGLGLQSSDLQTIQLAASSRLSPGKDSGASIELLLPFGTSCRRFVLGALPTAYSRHNTPSRSHSVSSIIKSNKGSRDLIIMVFPNDASFAFAQACAAARPFGNYSRKLVGVTGVDVDIVVHLPTAPAAEDDALISNITHVVGGIGLAQRLVDTPPNILHTDSYVAEARDAIAGIANCSFNVIQGEELDRQGFGGLWGVGKASEHLPALVVLSYVPPGTADQQSVCLVGKGIVYDTGGLSIKTPTTSMAGMKTDMGGSAAVLGAFVALAKSGVQTRVHGLLCISENSVGPLATRPDDVHTLLSGKTVEVNNTDAEGRLVLADGCFFASRDLNPKLIIDIATLTGAQLIATGKNHAAIFCSDEDLEVAGVQVGRETGDLTHPILYCPEFHKPEFRSQVADMKNSVADRGNAQSSCAGQFIGNSLETYLSAGGRWMHVDMAGPVSAGERATGYGVALLFGLTRNLA